MAIRVSLSHPLHYIDQNGVHRKLYGSQDRFYFRGNLDNALAGMLRIGDLYFPNASPLYFAHYGGDDEGTKVTDYDISYPVPQTIRGTTQAFGVVPTKVLSIGLRLFFNFQFGLGSSDGSAIYWNICRVQGINSQSNTGATEGDISVDKDITITFEFYSFNPDDEPGQTPQGSYSFTIPAGTSDIQDMHNQYLPFTWHYMKRTVTIDGVGTFTFPVSYAPWNDSTTVQSYKIHLGG